ncbi:MAG: ParB/RepB/Spo0J family partition protein [Hoeflea sp.]|uniref:ParB/RepB/Spo0J family partition protein n=1 Tax=Hoeflea sp. TaxID=1940281 RepID=UPI0032EE9919
MSGPRAAGKLQQINPDSIQRNPENPRVIFREEEMDALLSSIESIGIQVPLTVYRDRDRFFLIDGERRWRCAKKLNLQKVPCLVQEKPSPLENLLLMYNIHALREQWDYFTIASKLQKVEELMAAEAGSRPTEADLSAATGLTRGQIRRCRLLIDLPDDFKVELLEELHKPKIHQRLSEDFFIEMERSLKSVIRRFPEYDRKIDSIRRALISKYRSGSIRAVTDFRMLAKIATGVDNLDLKKDAARKSLDKLFFDNEDYNISDAYGDTVAFLYDEKQVLRNINNVNEFVQLILEEEYFEELEEEFYVSVEALIQNLQRVIRKRV